MKLNLKITTGVLAASLVFGGGLIGIQQMKAYADTPSSGSTTTGSSTTHGHFNRGPGGRFGGGNLVTESATILGMNASAIHTEMQQGKTLAAIAQEHSVTEDTFLQKLVTAETAHIHSLVTAGTITQTQADQQISGLSDRLKKQIENVFKGGPGRHFPGGFGFFGDQANIAKYLGITADELKADLQNGQSLADIAKAKGISETDLVTKIKDDMTGTIQKMVEHKGTWGKPKPSLPTTTPSSSQSN